MKTYAILAALAQSGAAAAGEAVEHCSHAGTARHTEICGRSGDMDDAAPARFEIAYTSEIMAVAKGGLDQDVRYLDNLDLTAELNLDRIAGLKDTTLFLYALYNNGRSISAIAGDALAVSNIEGDAKALRLYEAWIEKQFDTGLSIKAGLYDLNSEFDSLEASALFVGSAHGIGPDISQAGRNGPSIFPVTSLALRVEQKFGQSATIRAAIMDGVPGDPDDPGATAVKLSGDDGVLGIAELDFQIGATRLLAGHWRYSSDFETFTDGVSSNNAGTYIRAETPILSSGEIEASAFARLGVASGRINPFSSFASAGIHLSGIASAGDELGLAIAHARTSDSYRAVSGAQSSETVFEVTWRKDILPFLSVQPSLQYVINPSADPAIDNALVPGLRTVLSASF